MKHKLLIILIILVIIFLGFIVLIKDSKRTMPIIGIVQIASHPALDAVQEGVTTELQVQGFYENKNIHIDVQNASGQMNIARSICDKFVGDGAAVLIPITTPSSQACASSTSTIPIVFGAVTDPVKAGLVKSLERPGKNITGVSDIWPIKEQIHLILEVLPNVKRIGVVYNPGEANNDTTLPMMRRTCTELNLELREAFISNSTEIQPAASSLIGKVDAFYTSADSTVASGLEAFVKIARDNRTPLFVGDVDSVERGGIAALGINYNRIGRLTGELVARVLRGEQPSNIPVVTVKEFDLVVNISAAQKMGLIIPNTLLKRAKRIIK